MSIDIDAAIEWAFADALKARVATIWWRELLVEARKSTGDADLQLSQIEKRIKELQKRGPIPQGSLDAVEDFMAVHEEALLQNKAEVGGDIGLDPDLQKLLYPNAGKQEGAAETLEVVEQNLRALATARSLPWGGGR